MFFKKKTEKKTYDKNNQKPVIKASICNGEMVAVCIAKILNSTTDYILLGDERGSFEEELMRLAGKVRTDAVKNMILKQVRDAIEMEELLIKNTH